MDIDFILSVYKGIIVDILSYILKDDNFLTIM